MSFKVMSDSDIKAYVWEKAAKFFATEGWHELLYYNKENVIVDIFLKNLASYANKRHPEECEFKAEIDSENERIIREAREVCNTMLSVCTGGAQFLQYCDGIDKKREMERSVIGYPITKKNGVNRDNKAEVIDWEVEKSEVLNQIEGNLPRDKYEYTYKFLEGDDVEGYLYCARALDECWDVDWRSPEKDYSTQVTKLIRAWRERISRAWVPRKALYNLSMTGTKS